ncbi:TonB-dependent siderophore receptor [Dongia sp.]|uniref:TonB-dependent siderophore receptor n=1 Tax=Dongia sp. TaxID=1977262 RepID=UPI0035B35CEF
MTVFLAARPQGRRFAHLRRLTLVTGTALATLLALSAPAAAETTAATDPQAAQAEARNFEIAPQPLAGAIAAFRQQSGWVIDIDPTLLAGRASPGVTGAMAPDTALAKLLAGTGIDIGEVNAGRATLVVSGVPTEDVGMLDPLTVTDTATNELGVIGNVPEAYAGGQVATGGQLGMLGNRDIMDTPFSVTAYTDEVVKNQQARSLSDVVDNDPSVRVISSRAGYTDQYMIRGFPVYNDDIALNGMYGLLPRQIISPELAERIEIFKGPSALLNGVSPGGTIGGGLNLSPKHADDDPLTELTATYASNTQFGTQVDVGRRFGDDKEFGVRFNGAFRDGELSSDDQDQLMGLAFLGADYRGEDLRLSLDVGYQRQEFDRAYSFINLASGIDVPDAPDADKNHQEKWTYNETEDLFGVVRGEYDIIDDLTVFAAFGGSTTDQVSIGRGVTINNEDGDFTGSATNFPFYRDTISAQVGLRGQAEFLGMKHVATVQATTLRFEEGFGFGFASVNGSNIYDPIHVGEPDFSDNPIGKSNETELNSIAIADTISVWDERVQLTLGGRLQQVVVDAYSFSTGAHTSSYDEDALTPSIGLVIRPIDEVSLFANYMEGLAPGETAGATTSNAGQAFSPYRTDQIEFGVKVDLDTFMASLAFFEINRPTNGFVDASNTFVVDGEQRHRGIELMMSGEPVEGYRVLGGITLIDSDLSGTLNGNNDGNRGVGVPKVQMNIGGEVDVAQIPGLTISTRVIYTGEQYYDAANTQELPDWVRWDLGARYAFETHGTPITIRANVENVLGEEYWSSAGGGYLALGAPRTFLVSTSFNF